MEIIIMIIIFWKASQYIMSASGTNQDNLQFSSCSLEEINKKIEAILSDSHQQCFVEREQVRLRVA